MNTDQRLFQEALELFELPHRLDDVVILHTHYTQRVISQILGGSMLSYVRRQHRPRYSEVHLVELNLYDYLDYNRYVASLIRSYQFREVCQVFYDTGIFTPVRFTPHIFGSFLIPKLLRRDWWNNYCPVLGKFRAVVQASKWDIQDAFKYYSKPYRVERFAGFYDFLLYREDGSTTPLLMDQQHVQPNDAFALRLLRKHRLAKLRLLIS